MASLYSLVAMVVLVLVAALGSRTDGGQVFFGELLPYAAIAIFVLGFCYRVVRWALAPVPFRIPTTCGQQKSLPWIKPARLDNPSTGLGAVGRMALEVLLFRSLFRNSQARLYEGRYVFGENKFLWLGALAFHWALLVVLLRHLRLLLEPVPGFVLALERADSFFQIGIPQLYLSDVVLVCALAYLLGRRLRDPLVRYISLFTDYFALFLLLGIAVSGVLMRYWVRADIVSIKRMALGWVTFQPVLPEGVSPFVLVHICLICTLAIYFPFSKLMHMGGVFLSPTRNLANNSRSQRHVNPWNYPVKTHTYAEWEDEFRGKMKAAGIPLENDTDDARTISAN
jgi:nitrate reductase gamma subunit